MRHEKPDGSKHKNESSDRKNPDMQTVELSVAMGERTYPIVIGSGLLENAGIFFPVAARNRPLAVGRDKEKVLRRLARERNHHYDELADLVLLTDHKSPAMLAQKATDFLKAQDDPQACTKPKEQRP